MCQLYTHGRVVSSSHAWVTNRDPATNESLPGYVYDSTYLHGESSGSGLANLWQKSGEKKRPQLKMVVPKRITGYLYIGVIMIVASEINKYTIIRVDD